MRGEVVVEEYNIYKIKGGLHCVLNPRRITRRWSAGKLTSYHDATKALMLYNEERGVTLFI